MSTSCKKTILVVDDDCMVSETIRDVLSYLGFESLCVTDGKEALEELSRGVAARHPPDLILLDLGMAGMSGQEFLIQKAADPALADIPVVVISGNGDAARALAIPRLIKPLRIDRLLEAVESFCIPELTEQAIEVALAY